MHALSEVLVRQQAVIFVDNKIIFKRFAHGGHAIRISLEHVLWVVDRLLVPDLQLNVLIFFADARETEV